MTNSRLQVYAGFIKLEHTIFSLPLIVAGTVLHARTWPRLGLFALILLAAGSARVMAMGLNRIIDARIDAANPRTQRRELPRGAMGVREAWAIVAAAGIVYAISAAAIAPICLQLAPIPVALFVLYPYLKRFTSLAHLGLGLAWSTASLGGWLAAAASPSQAAVLSGVEWTASQSLTNVSEVGWLWLFSLAWVAGFDIIYATMDEAFDRQAGLHSLPVRLGKTRALHVAAIVHALAFAALVLLWKQQLHAFGSLVWLAAIGALFLWQHAVAARRPEFAFFQLNGWLGFLVLGFVISGVR